MSPDLLDQIKLYSLEKKTLEFDLLDEFLTTNSSESGSTSMESIAEFEQKVCACTKLIELKYQMCFYLFLFVGWSPSGNPEETCQILQSSRQVPQNYVCVEGSDK